MYDPDHSHLAGSCLCVAIVAAALVFLFANYTMGG